jgi:hypothetical protein
MIASVVDLAALWKILVATLLVGSGLTALYAIGVRSLARLAAARRDGVGADVAAHALVVAVVTTACACAVVLGVVAMTHK